MSVSVAARLARREVRRRPGRTALVAVLVALPVAAMVVAFVVQRTTDQSLLEDWRDRNGTFDLEAYQQDGAAPIDVPEGTSTVTVRTGYTRIRVPDGRSTYADVTDVPLADPRLARAVELTEGRGPRGADEVVLSPDLADVLDVGLGDRLDLDRPSLHGRVVGLAEQADCLSCRRIVVAPGQELDRVNHDGVTLLIDLPPDVSSAELDHLAVTSGVNGPSLWASRATVVAARTEPIAWTFVAGGIALTVMGVVITAAFAVGARRQLATLGQLSANGTAPRTLLGSLVLQGTFTGVIGAGVGLALATAVLVVGHQYVERAVDHRIDDYAVTPWPLSGALVIGVVTATVAAALPARTAARVPTLQAMAGRRPLGRVPRRMPLVGVLAVATGLGLLAIAVLGSRGGDSGQVWSALAVAGGVAQLLGACAIAPVVVSRLEPLARWLRGTVRLAARSLARQRTRSGAVIAAVCAAGAVAVCSGALVRGNEARDDLAGRLPDDVVLANVTPEEPHIAPGVGQFWVSEPPPPAGAEAVTGALAGAEAVPVRVAVGPFQVTPPTVAETTGGTSEGQAVVADDAVLDAFEVDDGVRDVLADRGVVVLAPRPQDVTVTGPDGTSWTTRSTPSRRAPRNLSAVLVTPLTARDAGMEVRTGATAFVSPEALTDDQRGALTDLLYDGTFGSMTVDWSSSRTGPSPFSIQLMVSGAALAFSVLVVGAGLALAAAESREERDSLMLAGAPPGVLARAAGAKAGLLSGLGSLLALPIGFLPVVVFCAVDEGTLPLRVPWLAVGALVVAVPLVASVVAWGTSGAAQRLRPVRISTMAWD